MAAGILFVLALTSGISFRVVTGVTSSTTSSLEASTTNVNSSIASSDLSSSYLNYSVNPDYPDCNSSDPLYWIGDGFCDTSLNSAICGWDGGDCCSCTCNPGNYDCSYTYYYCEDPLAPLSLGEAGCTNASLQPHEVPHCPQDEVELVVDSIASAMALATATMCSGGNFTVEWRGNVNINEAIHVLNGTRLNITGISDAEMDGGGTVRLFSVDNGSLYLSNMRIVNGSGLEGGAIILTGSSKLFADDVVFSCNTAHNVGGAIFAETSEIELMSTTFDGNSARYGGAIFMHSSNMVGRGNTSFINNTVSENGGALYMMENSLIALDSRYGNDIQSLDYYFCYHWIDYYSYHYSSYWMDYYSYSYSYWMDYYSISCHWTVIDDSGLISFFNNVAGGSGGASYADRSDIFWYGTALLQRNSARYGGALYLTYFSYFYFTGETTFASNEATADGGAIRATDYGRIYFTSNDSITFMENICRGNGGAISLSNFDVTAEGNVTFSRNSAGSSGGAMSISHVSTGPTLTGVVFSGNIADSGGAVYLSAVGTDVYLSTNTEHDGIAEYASHFTGCWFEGNSASSAGGAIHSIAGSDYVENTTFIKNSAANGGAIRVSGIIFLFNSSFEDNTSGDGGGPAMANEGDISKMAGVKFSGNGYYCPPDTFQDITEIGVEEGDRYNIVCSGCSDIDCDGCIVEDKHTIPVCSPLLPHTESGGDTTTLETLSLDRGYWRATNTSRDILECFNSKACRGGVTGNDTYCYTGYEGPYCAVCSQGYVRTVSYRCSECSSKTSYGPAVFAVFGGLAVLMLLLFVYYMVRIERGRNTRHSIDRFKKVLAIQSLKIIIVSWQIVTQFSEITNVVYPPLYRGLLDVIALVNFDFSWILAAGCFDIDFYDGLIAATAGPLAIIALLGLTYDIALRRNHGSELGRRIVRRKHVNAIILLAVLVYSSSSSAVFRTFVCDSLDDGNEYLRADYRLICTSPKHRAFQMYAGCMIAVYPLGIPVFFGILLFRNSKVLKNAALRTYNGELVQQSTSCLWKPYKPSVFYYEVVECGRRLMLTGIMVFIYPNTTAQIAVTLAMAFIFALSSEGLNPYDSRVDTWVARIGHVMVVLTMFVALLTKVDVSDEGSRSQNMFAAILVTAHTAMVITGVTEAVLLICSVQQNDLPRPRQRNRLLLPVDNFSSIHVRGRESDR